MRRSTLAALKILVLYDNESIHVSAISDHLKSLGNYSQNDVYYVPGTGATAPSDYLQYFDVLIIHYSIRINVENHVSPYWVPKIEKFNGFKILFIQDEYDATWTSHKFIKRLGVTTVFTCVPREFIKFVYPPDQLPGVEFVETLTGYVPDQLTNVDNVKPIPARKYLIGYRGRRLPYWYGKLGKEKFLIGKRVRDFCEKNKINNISIECDDDKRIYGDKWFSFIEDCRAMLGTESGSNVFDFDGSIRRNVTKALKRNPELTFEEAYQRYVEPHEGPVIMNQISPKIFEAIALKTALILFEGKYSSVLNPDEHYIPLKKDFSNLNQIIEKLEDEVYLCSLVNRAYDHVIKSGKYSYREMVRGLDEYLNNKFPEKEREPKQPLSGESLSGSRRKKGTVYPSKTILQTYEPDYFLKFKKRVRDKIIRLKNQIF